MEELQQPIKSQDFLGNGEAIFNITEHGYKELTKAGLTLDQLFYMEAILHKVDLRDIVSRDKLMTWKQSLVRKGFITESLALTVDGNSLLYSIGTGKPFTGALKEKREVREEDFEAWWKMYPSSSVFEYKGKKFEGSRAFKLKKEECRALFHKIVNEGEVTSADLIRSLEYEVLTKKEESFKTRENKLRYLKNTISYLNGRLYEGFLEVSKVPIASTKQTFEDI